MRILNRLSMLLAVLVCCIPGRTQDRDDFCYFTMMLDDSGPFPNHLGTAPAALLVSVIDYTNVYIPVDWERPLAEKFLDQGKDLGIDFRVAASGMALNRKGGDAELAQQLLDAGVENIVLYTVIYQRTPSKIKTGHTVAVMPFTGDRTIADMAGRGHWFVGGGLRSALGELRKKYTHRGVTGRPDLSGLSEKARVREAVSGLPDGLEAADLYMHGYYDACVPLHAPLNERWDSYYRELEKNNESMAANRERLEELLERFDLRLETVFLTEDLRKRMGEDDYLLVSIDDRIGQIRSFFIPIDDKSFMKKVPHDLEDPYYLFALFHPKSGKLYVPEIQSRAYGAHWESLEDALEAIRRASR